MGNTKRIAAFDLDDCGMDIAPGGCSTAVIEPFEIIVGIVIIAVILNPNPLGS